VDVTNCDKGTVGYPNYLFMAYGPAGSYANGYTFSADGSNIKYVYDDVTKGNFTEPELTISATKYEDTAEGGTAVRTIRQDAADGQFYSVSGMASDKAQKGLNIIRTQNGRTKKVIVK